MSGLIVHEWLEPRGGAERVVDAMVTAFPDADLLALWNDAKDRYPEAQETWLARTPLRHHKAAALPFEPIIWRTVRTFARAQGGSSRLPHDWILVSSHLFAHHVRPRGVDRNVPKYVYAHTPARYLWTPELDERGRSVAVRAAAALLKPLDRHRAAEAKRVAANSKFVRDRVRNAWERDATVIYPPVDVAQIHSISDWATQLTPQEFEVLSSLPSSFIFGASRFVPYKRLDWVIRAGESLDTAVVIAGAGPQNDYLHAVAEQMSAPVHFLGPVSTPMLYALYQRSAVFAFPPIEDFGIMPVEALAAGVPVAVGAMGGALESVDDGQTGAVAVTSDLTGFVDAVGRALNLDRTAVGEHAAVSATRFSVERFIAELREWIA